MVKKQGYQEPLEPRVLRYIREHHLLPEQPRLLVAVSGGPDSVCLLHILVRLQEELKVRLYVAHLNHQLRGVESEADAEYVSHLAGQLGIPASVERRDVKAYQDGQGVSLEEAAREVRYTFLAQVARSVGASRVAAGHTSDDHVETVLMHLIRGTGTRGLRGLQPSSEWHSSGGRLTIIRPLLQVSREETAAYCHDHQLMPRVDASNLSLLPLRNRIRHQLLPLLQSYNPRVVASLLRTARIAGDDFAFLDNESARLWAGIAHRQGDSVVLDKEKFLDLPSALQRHLLRAAIEELSGSLKDIEARHIEEVMAVLTKAAGKRLSLPGGLSFFIEYTRYLLGIDPAALSPFPALGNEIVLKVPGETLFPGWRVVATIVGREQMREKGRCEEAPLSLEAATSHPSIPAKGVEGMGSGGGIFTACLDFDKAGGEVTVRCRRRGDRFQPSGMSQPKKLGEFMIDAKIPRAWRQRVPVVSSPQHILWVVGWRTDDRVKVSQSTRRVLYLEFQRTRSPDAAPGSA